MKQPGALLAGTLAAASFAGGAAASLVNAPRVAAQARPGVVTTSQLNLVDRSGRLRAILSADDERGTTSLALLDPAGRRRAVLASGPDGAPSLELFDAAEAVRLHAAIEGSTPVVALTDTSDRRAILSSLTGGPALSFAEGPQVRAQLGLGASGLPSLDLVGPMGQRQLTLIVDGESQPVLTLRDQEGRRRASVGVVQNAAVINLADRTAPRVVLGVAGDGAGSLSFLDETGAVTRRVP